MVLFALMVIGVALQEGSLRRGGEMKDQDVWSKMDYTGIQL